MMDRRTFVKKSSCLAAGTAVGIAAGGFAFPLFHNRCATLNPPTIPVLDLKGSGKERGRAHGEALRDPIGELVARWKAELASVWGDPDGYIREFLSDTRFPDAINRWTPDLMEEVEGIAEGSAQSFETMFAFQCIDEEWWYGRNKKYGIHLPAFDKCSVIGVCGQDQPVFVAQNMDIYAYEDGFQILLRIKEENSELESLVFSQAGLIALNGMNNHRIAECVNALLQLDQRIDGLPVAFVNRGILKQETFEDAVDFVKSVNHASGQAYTIGGPENVMTFECSAQSAVRFESSPNATRLFHTNHPFVNPDQEIFRTFLKAIGQQPTDWYPNSSMRYAALEKRPGDPDIPVTIQSIKDALSSHDDPANPVCRHKNEDGTGGFTFGCSIYELGPKPRLHLAPGPPCSTSFEIVSF